MRYLLDTDSCIYLFADSHPHLSRRVTEARTGEIAVSSVTFAELAMGSAQRKPPSRELLSGFADEVPILAFDKAAAWAYATLPFRRGRFDRLLAAHVLSLDATLITNNERDFADLPGLKVENWTLP